MEDNLFTSPKVVHSFLNPLASEILHSFMVSHWDRGVKLFIALATDITYGIKGFHYLRFLCFGAAVRLDWYFWKKKLSHFLFVECVKK